MDEKGKVIKKSVAIVVLVLLAGALAFYLYINKDKNAVPQGFVKGNGRLEATEVDIAAKLAGRLTEVLAKEGDLVDKNQIVAKIDMSTLLALLKQAEAEVKRAKQARKTALSRVEGIRLKMEFAVKSLSGPISSLQRAYLHNSNSTVIRQSSRPMMRNMQRQNHQSSRPKTPLSPQLPRWRD